MLLLSHRLLSAENGSRHCVSPPHTRHGISRLPPEAYGTLPSCQRPSPATVWGLLSSSPSGCCCLTTDPARVGPSANSGPAGESCRRGATTARGPLDSFHLLPWRGRSRTRCERIRPQRHAMSRGAPWRSQRGCLLDSPSKPLPGCRSRRERGDMERPSGTKRPSPQEAACKTLSARETESVR